MYIFPILAQQFEYMKRCILKLEGKIDLLQTSNENHNFKNRKLEEEIEKLKSNNTVANSKHYSLILYKFGYINIYYKICNSCGGIYRS